MHKVYLAGPFSWQERIRGYAKELEALGFVIISEWLYQTPSFTTPDNSTVLTNSTWDTCQQLSERDIRNIFEADTLILFEPGIPLERNTRVAEFGGALFSGRQCFVIGPEKESAISNIFVKLAKTPKEWQSNPEMKKILPVYEFRTWEEFLADLG